MNKQFNGRDFQLWDYRVSHGQLLIRSPKSPAENTNVDIVFVGVDYIDSPRHLSGLRLEEPTDSEVAVVSERLGRTVDRKAIFILVAQGMRHIVVAVAVKVAESDMDIFDSPLR